MGRFRPRARLCPGLGGVCLAALFSSAVPVTGQSTPTPAVPAQTEAVRYRNYVGTSLFALPSLIPGDDIFFLELDYGLKLTPRADVIVGANAYQYISPMSTPWGDDTRYPGHVLSFGLVLAHQRYVWKQAFLDGMVNPLVLRYHGEDDSRVGTGFMLLCAARVGYHFDFDMFGKPFYLEPGGEVSFWPYNGGVPAAFRAVDDAYGRHVFSPALQFGYRF